MRRALPPVVAAVATALLVTLLPAESAAGQRIDEIFERGNQAYFQGNTDAAIRAYRRLVEAGVHDPDLYFNLGTAHARAGQWGRAILSFERVLHLRPGDEGAEQGLAAAREQLGRERAQAKGEATVRTSRPFGETLARPFSTELLAWLLLVFDFLLFGLLAARRFARGESARLALGIAAPLVAVSLVLAAAGLGIKTGVFEDGEPAIVLEPDVVVREGPDPRAARRAEAHEGERAHILDHHDGFVRVRLPGGREGWIRATHVEAIRPPKRPG